MRKSEQICARVTEEEMECLRQLAARRSILLSELIRRTLANEIASASRRSASD